MTVQSCESCPNYSIIDAGGGTQCLAKGIVLSNALMSPERVSEAHQIAADGCDKAGVEQTITNPLLMVTTPDMKAVNYVNASSKDTTPSSCDFCIHFVDETHSAKLGYNNPICAASGRLLVGDLSQWPQKCGVGVNEGTFRSTNVGAALDGLVPLPQLSSVMVNITTKAEAAGTMASTVGATAESDAATVAAVAAKSGMPEITKEQADSGIIAWHEVTGKGARGARYLPVFDPDSFCEEERALIPQTDDKERPGDYIDYMDVAYALAVASEEGQTPIFEGGAGLGKTEAARYLAWIMQVPFGRINIKKSTETDHLVGKYTFEVTGGEKGSEVAETVWTNGRLTDRFIRRGVLLLDEPNMGPNEVWEVLRPLCDDSSELVLDESKGERFPRHKWNFLMLAQNAAYDPLYVGAQEISAADGDRLMPIAFELPPESVERDIITKALERGGKSLTKAQLDAIMNIARDLRQSVENEELSIAWNIRPQIKVAKLIQHYDFPMAYRRAVIDRLDPLQAEAVLRIVSLYVTEGL